MISNIYILTLFPDVINKYLDESILGRAQKNNKVSFHVHNIRDKSTNKHFKVDDIPFGGSTGMVMMLEPIILLLEEIGIQDKHVVLTSPKGARLNNDKIKTLKEIKELVIIAGHYEGIDSRINNYVDEEISIGDYVLTGGELPALVITDSLVRCIPSVLGNTDSLLEESFEDDLLDWDVYTRPRVFDAKEVPDVLFSGNHKKIEHWKQKSAIINTLIDRPSVFAKHRFTEEQKIILKDYLKED
jgi:tRNA (guanine37-N1)-methyltransferase